MRLKLDESYTGEFDDLTEDQLFEKAITGAMRAVEQILDSSLRKAKSPQEPENDNASVIQLPGARARG